MDNLAADFIINLNNPIEAEFELGETEHFDCSFELLASGTVWGSIDGNIENQTDLYDILSTQSGQITSNHNEITSLSGTLQSYGDIVTYDAADFATAAQGVLANTALQPGDNISELVNNAGYITSADLPTLEDLTTQAQMNAINSGATTVNIAQIASNTQAISTETENRQNADNGLQSQIDAIVASSDVFDIVGTYAELQAYDISTVPPNDIIKVLVDSTHNNAATYYRCVETGGVKSWSYIGSEGAYYTKSEADGRFVPLERTINGKALSNNITLDATDVGALPSSTVIPVVDQTFDGTSTNAQSGVAINGAKFLQNTATGNSSITVNGTATAKSQAINIGTGSQATGNYGTALGAYSFGNASHAVGIGNYAKATADYAIQLNKGTNNTSNSLFVGFNSDNYQLLDGTTGLIPDARISSNIARTSSIPTVNDATLTIQKNGTTIDTFTANSATNTTVNITVPTDTGDLTNNAGYITGITSGDVTTALGYTPYNSTNPNGYTSNIGTVTSVNNTQPDANGNVTISTGGTVDQTYDGTSTNAQSGVAIAGAGFLQNISSNAHSISVLGTATGNSYSINIGKNSSVSSNNCIAIGYGAQSQGNYALGFGYYARAKAQNAIQLGYGTNNTADSLQIGSYQLLDGTTGLIPDARLSSNIARTSDIPTVNDATLTIQKNGTDVQTFTANASSNVTCNITVPTDTSDLTNGAGYITASSIPTDYYTKSEIDSLIPQPTKVPIVYYQPTDSYCYNESNNRFYGSHVTEKLYLAQPKTSGTTQVIDMSTTFALSFTIDYKKAPSSSITLAEIMTSYSAGKGVLLQLTSTGLYYKNNVSGTTISGTRTLAVGNSYDIKVEYDGTHMIISYKLSSDLNYTQANSTTCIADGSNYNYAAINMDTGYGNISLSSVTLTNDGNTLYSYTAGQIALNYDSSLTLNASNQLKVVVDQTYNASSTNPQSGVAIASAGFVTSSALSGYLENIATGANSLTIMGTATNKSYSINIGWGSTVTGLSSMALGNSATVTGQGSIAIGNSAEANADNAIAIGSGAEANAFNTIAIKGINNTAHTFQVYTYNMLDLSTGLIPDARISTNIARTIDVANTDLSNLSSTGTKVLDGQWVAAGSTLLDSVTFAASTATDYSLSTYLPDDGYQYEVLMSIIGRTGTTSGNAGQFYVGSQLLGTTLCLATVRAQGSSYNYFGGAMTIPIGTDRILRLQNVATVATTNTTVRLGAYRRIGTNS